MKITAGKLAAMIGGTCDGNPDVEIFKPCKIEEGEKGGISFLGNLKYEHFLYNTNADAVIVSDSFQPKQALTCTLIRVNDVYGAVTILLGAFEKTNNIQSFKSPLAFIDTSSVVADNTSIEAFCFIGKNATIGSGSWLGPGVFIGDNVKIGDNTILHPGVKIYHDCIVGNQVVIHANSIVGSDGFGFSKNPDGTFNKISQIGNVVIENNVEIGANTVIDRATMGSTFIRQGVKLDNLIQIAHNADIGENTAIAAQTGVAGSTKIGQNCLIGGQVGIIGHIQIADGTMIQAQSGVSNSVKESGTKLYGSPAIDFSGYLRSFAIFRKLPDLLKRLEFLEKNFKK